MLSLSSYSYHNTARVISYSYNCTIRNINFPTLTWLRTFENQKRHQHWQFPKIPTCHLVYLTFCTSKHNYIILISWHGQNWPEWSSCPKRYLTRAERGRISSRWHYFVTITPPLVYTANFPSYFPSILPFLSVFALLLQFHFSLSVFLFILLITFIFFLLLFPSHSPLFYILLIDRPSEVVASPTTVLRRMLYDIFDTD